MIHLLPFRLDRKKYLKILLYNRFRRYWWMYLLMLAVALMYIPQFNAGMIQKGIVIFPFAYIAFLFIWFYRWTYSSKNANLYNEVRYSFDTDNLHIESSGSSSSIAFDKITEYRKEKEYWLIYLSKGQFFYIPLEAFQNKQDRQQFSDRIVEAVNRRITL